MADIYRHFANPWSPGGDRSRRQRRREKERLARWKWESQHFFKIVNCSPTPERPLQGIWKVVLCDRETGYMASSDNRGQKGYILVSPQYASIPDPRQNVKNNRGRKPLLHWCPHLHRVTGIISYPYSYSLSYYFNINFN